MKIPSIVEMLQAGVHFGHQVSRWHPKMEEYIFTERNGVHVIDLEKTKVKLEETLEAVRAMAAEGKEILFITTKPQAREIVREAAISCESPYLVERWMGGLLTNFDELKKLFKKYNGLKEQQANGELEKYTKQEQSKITKDLEKMEKTLAGLSYLEKMPEALFVPSVQREKTAVDEANKTGVPIIGICDTNANPEKAEYVIPANDDAVNAIKLMVGLVAEAIKEGKEEFKKKEPVKKAPVMMKKTVRPEKSDRRGLDWN
ncbi:MAG: 30S ribosomal protein S2 [Candidatus Magasanikbacteria bacterium RIFOXYC2_FULL_40_16]|uniref:Small ribosomal subunit protein uS2 n=2 Tax=Candidatus Magasanikiibacteriota TaxID=1752731 RepID=A0A1F6NEK8_9BACT|nr:MAG: 30S ribosomal protein S2 [Candidatus Magasanikbacteria bacterium RIFOXYA2_FULL_40_20]OGH82416.1 MAG: 30S ribosomal protein S2 [Candidatus Magasanikbacteria bacterium RIFOXYB1_FULL_40_15]OGH85277.1 MAG: 30S ribosomal protein S2 [Candidatus Magasanikbacteria bacterium RIFOXYB2_FULL_40_13]OGH89305.1 MAG: 30S ribosomal protein S2 [Candidatus Magasanikbacteria bacterium RIFOXYC2_FULL_40_16]